MNASVRILLATVLVLGSSQGLADGEPDTGPEAGARTYAQNYKDMVLATCIANAYANDSGAAMDAGSSASTLMDWTYFDLEKSPDVSKSLIDRYLARNYHNPLVEAEIKGVRFDFLKCLDLYHSKELAAEVRRLVINPKRTYRQDNPPRQK